MKVDYKKLREWADRADNHTDEEWITVEELLECDESAYEPEETVKRINTLLTHKYVQYRRT